MLNTDQLFGFEEGELGAVLQLSPHKNTDQVRSVAKPEDGEPLVSLDDVYEVTGQEAISVLVHSCKEYFNKGKLAKQSMTCLNLAGTENFIPIFDKYNARLGGESFIDKLKKGFVTIIKAILGYIRKVVDWAVVRIKSLFGYSKTEKELAAIAKEASELNLKIMALVGSAHSGENNAGGTDVTTFIESLPEYLTSKEAITMIRNKAVSGAETIERLATADKEIAAADAAIQDVLTQLKSLKSRYDIGMDNIRRMRDEGSLMKSDIVKLAQSFDERISDGVFENMFKVTAALMNKVYSIDISNLGMEPGFRARMQAFQNQIIREKSPWNAVNTNDYTRLEKGLIERVNRNMNSDTASKVADIAKKIGSVQDATDIQNMSKLPGVENIHNAYLQFMTAYSTYIDMVETCAEQLQNVRATIDTAVKWNTSLKTITNAYLLKDAEEIVKWHAENKGVVDPEQSKHLLKNGRPVLLYTPSELVQVHFQDEKGTVMKQQILDVARELLKTPDNKKRVNNLLGSLGLQLRV